MAPTSSASAAGDEHRQRQGKQGIADPGAHADRRDISAGAEESGMAKREHAAEAEHQIEAAGSQGKDHHAGREADIELLAEGLSAGGRASRASSSTMATGF
jgi:hypothetical protein